MSLSLILLLVGIVVFVTHTLEAITGFGCTVLALPFVILLMGDIEQAKIILSILAWLLALYFVIAKFRSINWNQFGIIILVAGLGMPLGIFLFKSFDPSVLKILLGIFIVVAASVQLIKAVAPSRKVHPVPAFFGYSFLFLGGTVHGAFASGGPLIVLYSAKRVPDKGQFRATMCLIWTTLNTVLIMQYLMEGKLTWKVGLELVFLLPFLIGGIIVGEIIHSKVNEILFKKIILVSLLLIGIVMTFFS